MVGEHSTSRRAVFVLAALTISCGDAPSDNNTQVDPPTDAELRQAVLENVGEQVILAQYVDFAQAAAELTTAAEAWAADGTQGSRDAAKAAWRTAMTSWQRAEVYQLGPAGIMGQIAGGEDLRDAIYSWPLTSACRIDQETVNQDFANATFFTGETAERVNVRGLDTMERVLFADGYGNACSAASDLNTMGTWAALSEQDIDSRRAAYTVALARDVQSRADQLVNHWQADGENFLGEFTTAGSGSATYGSTQEALNALSDALFYIEKETKEMKLAIPAGVSGCVESTCPDDRESLYANFSKEKMLANLAGFRAAFTGGDGDAAGLDDLLVSVGAEQLSADMIARLDEATAAIEAWPGSLADQLASDPQSVVDAHDKVDALGDLLKTQFVGTLDLELPQRAEGDND